DIHQWFGQHRSTPHAKRARLLPRYARFRANRPCAIYARPVEDSMMTKNALTMVIVLLSWMSTTACSRDIQAMTPDQIQRQYGVTGAYADTITTAEGPMKGTMVPVTLADGRQAKLFIPSQRTNEPHSV